MAHVDPSSAVQLEVTPYGGDSNMEVPAFLPQIARYFSVYGANTTYVEETRIQP